MKTTRLRLRGWQNTKHQSIRRARQNSPVAIRSRSSSNPRTMIPGTIAPKLSGADGPVVPTICRLSRDMTQIAFWMPRADPAGLFVGTIEGDDIGAAAKRVWSPTEQEHLSDLAWS